MALIEKLTAIADGFRESRGTTDKLTLDDMAELAAEAVGGGAAGENKLPQVLSRTITELTEADLAGTTSIFNSAFSGCSQLGNVYLPSSLISIGNGAFHSCEKLKIFFSDNCQLESIGTNAFYQCRGLATNLVLPNSITTIGASAFQNCTMIKTITISSGVTIIDSNTFNNCQAVQEISFGENSKLEKINSQAFYKCFKLAKITIPETITSIGTQAFYDCKALAKVYIYAKTPPTIQANTFYNVPKSTCKIYVPAEAVDAYKEATNWSSYAACIYPIEEA